MSISRMPIDQETWEQQLDSQHRPSRRTRAGRARDRPPQKRPRDRPRRPPWAGDDDFFDESWRKRPCPSPLAPHPRTLRHLTSVCEERTDLLSIRHAARYRPALLALSARRREWVRPLDAWDPPDGEPPQQFARLLRHLLSFYDLPRFLDAAWLEGLTPDGITYQGWYTHVGRGRSIRTARGLPLPLTRRMAHHFMRAPDECRIPEAIRYAQVLALGGDERLARSLLGTRIGGDFRDEGFWGAVILWFVAHPALAPVHHGPIIDYLHAQKFEPTAANPASRIRGQPRAPLLVPPRPSLTMKGRTPGALLRAVEAWHMRLGSGRPASVGEWEPSGIAPLALEVGRGEGHRVYETVELICPGELRSEGAAMSHCVAGYWKLCASGQTSIWSMTIGGATGAVERLLTLEIRGDPPLIVQARGHGNRLPTAEELDILARWAESGGPAISTWLVK